MKLLRILTLVLVAFFVLALPALAQPTKALTPLNRSSRGESSCRFTRRIRHS